MSNDRDRIAGMIDNLLFTRHKQASAGIARDLLRFDFDGESRSVQGRHREMIRSVSDQKQALLDVVTTDAGHAAKWRELVEQLDLDLDDTEVPHVFDAFNQDSQKDDGADEEHAESAPALTAPAPQSPPDPQEHPLIRIHAFKGEELDEPIDAAWHDELFVSFRGGSFPDKSNAAFLREVTRWSPLEAREVSGDD